MCIHVTLHAPKKNKERIWGSVFLSHASAIAKYNMQTTANIHIMNTDNLQHLFCRHSIEYIRDISYDFFPLEIQKIIQYTNV